MSTMTWLGCALAFVGVAVLGMDGGAAAAELGGGFNLGDWLALAGAASYSCTFIASARSPSRVSPAKVYKFGRMPSSE